MSLPVIVYIDDSAQDARSVQRALHKHFIVHAIRPNESLDELIDQIFAYRPDAVIADFRLTDMIINIGYDGYQVIQTILDTKDKFPVFILTSNQGDAFAEVDDVNFVYEKSQLYVNSTFPDRVTNQIFKYKRKLEEGEKRILALLAKRADGDEGLSMEEEKELIELDDLIEKSLDKKSAVPEELKVTSNEKRMSDMLREVDELMEKVKKNLPN